MSVTVEQSSTTVTITRGASEPTTVNVTRDNVTVMTVGTQGPPGPPGTPGAPGTSVDLALILALT